ncbi:MAG: helix-turn-helix transcriptional regulator [Clostridia bacterium]|nr:helix-turn-helix transcriptional regulator [Clostridia bacterium]
MTIGNRITELRKALGLSQEDLADKLGVSRQAVSKWETDVSAPDAFNLIALSKVLQTNVEYIVTGKEVKDVNVEVKNNTDKNHRSNLSILGFILLGGGILMAIIGMFLDFIWCLIGGFVAVTGIIFALVQKKKHFLIAFPILIVVIAVVIFLITF